MPHAPPEPNLGDVTAFGGDREMDGIAVWHGWGFVPFFWVGWILILVLIFGFGGRWFGWRRYAPPEDRASGERVLAERFARGEIDEDEYRRRLSVLRERRS
jgi:putative membrane protein